MQWCVSQRLTARRPQHTITTLYSPPRLFVSPHIPHRPSSSSRLHTKTLLSPSLCMTTAAYYDDGVLIMEPRRIAWQYGKTWFAIDALSSLPVTSSSTSDAANLIRL